MKGIRDPMKLVERGRYSDPDVAARKLVEIANGIEPAQDGRIFIERVNAPFLAAGGRGGFEIAERRKEPFWEPRACGIIIFPRFKSKRAIVPPLAC
jgi:hypothetical protein